jgi:hypothetical protein
MYTTQDQQYYTKVWFLLWLFCGLWVRNKEHKIVNRKNKDN